MWYTAEFENVPNSNKRLNSLILDFSSAEDLQQISPQQASQLAIDQIVAKHPGPYTLLASGGIDSQVMILMWVASGYPFSVVHYSYGTNTEDTATLRKLCAKFLIPFKLRHFDAKQFITSPELIELAKRYDCSSPQILTYIKFTSNHSETCMMAGNFIGLQGCGLNWTLLAMERFASLDKKNFIPFFLMYTPELAYSFLDLSVKIAKDHLLTDGGYSVKNQVYKAAGYDVIQQSSKLTGFEEIKASFDDHKIPALNRIRWAHKPSRRPFDLLYRYALLDHIGDYNSSYKIIHPASINKQYSYPEDYKNAVHY